MSDEILKNYPPQPPATNWPSGLDTPEKEAFYRDLNQEKSPCLPFVLCYVAALILTWILMTKYSALFYDRNLTWGENLFSIVMTFVAALIPMMPLMAGYFLISRLIIRVKLRKKYGFILWFIRRKNVLPVYKKILRSRPEYQAPELIKYWPDAQHFATAEVIQKLLHKNSALPQNALYPNDPIFILNNFFYDFDFIEFLQDFEETFQVEIDTAEQLFDPMQEHCFAELVEIALHKNIKTSNNEKRQ
ncbi:MAG: hypothetical protein RR060_04595 [Victivallaceae bacterium]